MFGQWRSEHAKLDGSSGQDGYQEVKRQLSVHAYQSGHAYAVVVALLLQRTVVVDMSIHGRYGAAVS